MSSVVYSSAPPRALVTFTDVLGTAATITIYRTADGRTEEVRGGTDLSAAAPFAMDYEVAVGVLNTWRAQMFAADGTDLGFTEQVSYSVAATEGSWLQQPLAPETAIRVRIAIESGASTRKPTPGEFLWPEGAEVARFIGGRRRGVVGQNIRIYAEYADLAKIDGMFGDYVQDYPSILLLRTPPPLRFPRVYFMGIPDPEEFREGMYALAGYNFVATEARAPYPGLLRPLLRRMDIDAAYPTRAARAAAYATRIARDQDYTKAGLAG